MKSYAGIEGFLLKATAVEGGFTVSGTLPWVSNLGEDHYCGAIATIQGGARLEARDRVKSLAPPTPIEFGAMVDELASKPRAARR